MIVPTLDMLIFASSETQKREFAWPTILIQIRLNILKVPQINKNSVMENPPSILNFERDNPEIQLGGRKRQ